MEITTEGPWFKDERGRTLILRGVNLGGSTKVPSRPNGATHLREGLFDHREVSFVGRPFPIEDAHEHFARLRAWELTLLRLLVTWEAVEHGGPGVYDRDYLDYLYEVVRLAAEHGLKVFIDPHQDVWSRMSGGDGAPGWTFEAVGMDVTHFTEAGAAIVHNIHGDPFPRMIWPTNYSKLAAATMFTLFFGGNDFAPGLRVEGEPVQGYLQSHYVNAIRQIALRLRGLPNVIGYDTMNEPSPGFIGWPDLSAPGGLLRLGDCPTPYQAMLLGDGIPQTVDVYGLGLTGLRRRGRRLVNAGGISVWRGGRPCIWRRHGVWDLDSGGVPRLLHADYFSRVGGRSVSFDDYLLPFLQRYARAIRAIDPGALIFVEGVPRASHSAPPGSSPRWKTLLPEEGTVYAAHWYDGLTLLAKRYFPWAGVDFATGKFVLGRKRLERSFAAQLRRIRTEAQQKLGQVPVLLGEFGIPFDMNGGSAFRTGDFAQQVQAMDRTYRALDANLLSGTVWNYTADNDNRRGDQWNGEDLSIYSPDQRTDPADINSGGRALEAVVRPYAHKVAGEPLHMDFDLKRRAFRFSFRHDPAVEADTEIFVPHLHYPEGCGVTVSDGSYELDREAQCLHYRHSPGFDVHTLTIRPVREQPRG